MGVKIRWLILCQRIAADVGHAARTILDLRTIRTILPCIASAGDGQPCRVAPTMCARYPHGEGRADQDAVGSIHAHRIWDKMPQQMLRDVGDRARAEPLGPAPDGIACLKVGPRSGDGEMGISVTSLRSPCPADAPS